MGDHLWSARKSAELYRLDRWGFPYFDVSAMGHVMVRPNLKAPSVDLFELVQSLARQNHVRPLLIRFPEITGDRISKLHQAFASAIARHHYPQPYQLAFPLKCNQERQFVEAIVAAGMPWGMGLEVGSKAELAIALAQLPLSRPPHQGSVILCNGYKDRGYLEMALLGLQLGQRVIITIEQLTEIRLIVQTAQQLGLLPRLGVRVQLSQPGHGHWADSTGTGSKFGLKMSDLMEAVSELRAAGLLSCLQLLHFHVGSQVSCLSVMRAAVQEATHLYAELLELGASMGYLDIGGGLAVDYDGLDSIDSEDGSRLDDYANEIVQSIGNICQQRQMPPPQIISESGRAITAHQSVLIFDVLNVTHVARSLPPQTLVSESVVTRRLRHIQAGITADNAEFVYREAIQLRQELLTLFARGQISLSERAIAEDLYEVCCQRLVSAFDAISDLPMTLRHLPQTLNSIYLANFSIFQSLPDVWGIQQSFPIMPIHRLNEQPLHRGVLADLTCDSDGKIAHFSNQSALGSQALPLHNLRGQEPYCLGVFLVGAYQETLGSLHNLFGPITVFQVHFQSEPYVVTQASPGDDVSSVLADLHYEPQALIETLRSHLEQAQQTHQLTSEQANRLMEQYCQDLRDYTYLKRR